MRKLYIAPTEEVIELKTSQSLLLTISADPGNSGNQTDAESRMFDGIEGLEGFEDLQIFF
ncbi:MAG: hypothetical protein IJV44_00770 [Prevotella sp.]|nr:hypothetical protein [Prevotella sp.]